MISRRTLLTGTTAAVALMAVPAVAVDETVPIKYIPPVVFDDRTLRAVVHDYIQWRETRDGVTATVP